MVLEGQAKVGQEDQAEDDWVQDEEVVVQEEEVGLAKAKVLDAVQAKEQRVDEVKVVDRADEVREDWAEELLVNFVENAVESKVNMSDMYSKSN